MHQLKEGLFSEALQGRQAPRILDLGCGSGPNLQYWAQYKVHRAVCALSELAQTNSSGVQDARVLGVEPNSAMLPFYQDSAEQAGLRPDQLSFANGLAEELPAEDASQDLVSCTLVSCYLLQVTCRDRAAAELQCCAAGTVLGRQRREVSPGGPARAQTRR